MVFYTLVLKFYFRIGQKKEDDDDTFLRKKNRRKTKQRYHTDICWWKRGSFSSEVKIARGIIWIKKLQKESFKKDLVKFIETNHQINMTSDHSVSSLNLFKSQLNAKSFNMFLQLYQLC